ncbi:MAG TPA: sigma-70 family RNA polymerase sigma factor [Planctomycetota bacterium]|nr:sigma-70 family RNA polymerase sigma factor [Planctomycetota bacterium]
MVKGRDLPAGGKHLVDLMIRGDEGAWDRFVEVFGSNIRETIRTRSSARPSSADQEEIYSQVLARLVERECALLRKFRWECSLETYLTFLARSECHRYWRNRLIAQARGRVPDAQPPVRVSDESVDRVRKALSTLSFRDRILLRMVFFEGMRYAEAAEALGVSPNSVGPLLGRAITRIKRELPQNE